MLGNWCLNSMMMVMMMMFVLVWERVDQTTHSAELSRETADTDINFPSEAIGPDTPANSSEWVFSLIISHVHITNFTIVPLPRLQSPQTQFRPRQPAPRLSQSSCYGDLKKHSVMTVTETLSKFTITTSTGKTSMRKLYTFVVFVVLLRSSQGIIIGKFMRGLGIECYFLEGFKQWFGLYYTMRLWAGILSTAGSAETVYVLSQ